MRLCLILLLSTAWAEKVPPKNAAEARARKALQREFVEVAKSREKEIRGLAKTILTALQKGEIEPLVADCSMYSSTAKNRRELTRTYLSEHLAALQTAAKLADVSAPDFAKELQFESPSPETGMTGQVKIPFGPKSEKPPGSAEGPPRHELELWWSGEVMPEANGPLHEMPPTPRPKSRWRFHQLITPYSQHEAQLE